MYLDPNQPHQHQQGQSKYERGGQIEFHGISSLAAFIGGGGVAAARATPSFLFR